MRHRDTRKICVFFVVDFMFMLVELLYGMWANSLGLISDAAHMLFDFYEKKPNQHKLCCD